MKIIICHLLEAEFSHLIQKRLIYLLCNPILLISFFFDSNAEIPGYASINNYLIGLIENKKLFYSPIYSFE